MLFHIYALAYYGWQFLHLVGGREGTGSKRAQLEHRSKELDGREHSDASIPACYARDGPAERYKKRSSDRCMIVFSFAQSFLSHNLNAIFASGIFESGIHGQ